MKSRRFARGTTLIAIGAAALIAIPAGAGVATEGITHGHHDHDNDNGDHHGRHHDHHDHHHGSYVQRAIVSDQQGVAPVTDPDLVNPWGLSFGPTTPLWAANNGTSTSTLYSTNPPTKVPLTVATQPGPTGTVFNDTKKFALPDGTASNFLFDSLSGQLSAWGGGTQTTTTATVPGASFTGLALAHTKQGPRLYAADAATTNVIVFNGKFHRVGTFTDRKVPKALTTYNVAVIGKKVYVSYAAGPGVVAKVRGAVDVFSLNGHLQRRLLVGGKLNDPWGMVVAPANWGRFGGALLVGNEKNGEIHAYNRHSGRFLGTVRNEHGNPIGHNGLWGMAFGNGVFGTHNDLIISMGVDNYQHGLIALVHPKHR